MQRRNDLSNSKAFSVRAEQVLGGYGWKARLARGTGHNYASVKRWASGASPVPGAVVALVDCLEAMTAAGLPLPERFT